LVFFAVPGQEQSLPMVVLMLVYVAVLWRIVNRGHRAYWRAQAGLAQMRTSARRFAGLSRMAGKAEVATCILHDVGNALNSLKTSMLLADQRAAEMPAPDLEGVAALLSSHADDLGRFFRQDPRAPLLVPYLADLAGQWREDRQSIGDELRRAHEHVEHIERIIGRQQEHARLSEVEVLSVDHILADATDFVTRSFQRAGVQLTVSSNPQAVVNVDRHHVLQILINLLKNALDAIGDHTHGAVFVGVDSAPDGMIDIRVEDNGCGIAPEDVGRIFGHGFTTKEHGHGFGLHSSLLVARAMGGDLSFASEGVGRGSQFLLRLPGQTQSLAA
jgi:signal transduction histidine kinase